ncbi:MAG: bifunctional DNA-formamidopyrimidine glycosylase/DNA-(apurinic or apyrimidinic site) lyase [Gammaproteobacteria bacterium]|nr:bifunctional DNA-formamidopyrimidine glycosylase/DNA-(apurinic or apyrimidinic site) lyase [Gammaproteobacteria bacterium]
MPELPEVETTVRGIAPHISNQRISDVVVRQTKLRYPVPDILHTTLRRQILTSVSRRAKYLLLHFENGTMIIHLGMSGSLRILTSDQGPGKHDHVDLIFENGKILRYRDPRRFGMIDWTDQSPESYHLLSKLGPEPFDVDFNGGYLFQLSRKRSIPVKQLVMDNHVVVGVGNIYASESLFLSGIRPGRRANRVTQTEFDTLARNIVQVLQQAITQGGTTLKDFTNSDGRPGYFAQSLNVYGRAGEPCTTCGSEIKSKTIAQRNSFYCPRCQT